MEPGFTSSGFVALIAHSWFLIGECPRSWSHGRLLRSLTDPGGRSSGCVCVFPGGRKVSLSFNVCFFEVAEFPRFGWETLVELLFTRSFTKLS